VDTGSPRFAWTSLRFRLTASYALFFTLLLALLSFGFRQFLAESLDAQMRATLDQDWATLKGYFRIEKGTPHWYVDQTDPEELAVQGRLRRVFYVADPKGAELDSTDIYKSLGAEPKNLIQQLIRNKQTVWRERQDRRGEHYLVRAGAVGDENPDFGYYYVAIGRSLKENRNLLNRFTWLCIGLIPAIALAGCVVGWIYASRALSPVMDIARTAQRISGSNLSMRIPTTKSGDELDYLIRTFNRMIERLEQSFNQIRQFSTDVSHELRTPITVIRGQLEVALFTAETPEQYRDTIVDCLHDIERLSQIVRALLSLSQAETGQVVLQPARYDLNEIATDLVDQFQIPAESAGVRLRLEECFGDCHADIDRVQIERMFTNLLSNAVKFTPSGGEVAVSVRDSGPHVEIEIRDTGKGIAPEHLPHIFDRFYRVASASADVPEKGLGLGLSFVAWIVKAHHGTVDVHSTPGQGTTFTFRLPRQGGVQPALESYPEPEHVKGL
jgi:heavy metal sensor kinase